MGKESLEKLREFLEHQAQASIERGFFKFGPDGPFTDVRFKPESLYVFKDGWCELAADLLLKVPTGGLVGILNEDEILSEINWLENISKKLENRGAEMPVSWVLGITEEVFGTPLSSYHKNSPVTIFTAINTLGGTLDSMVRWLGEKDIRVGRAIALIDRNPGQMTETPEEKIPLVSVLHLPLPLYGPDKVILFTDLPFLPPQPRRLREICGDAVSLIS